MTIVSVVGARPQFIKLAPVSEALRAAGFHDVVVHTGQHYDDELSTSLFTELGMPLPAFNLEVGSASHGVQLGRMLERLEPVLTELRPRAVIVYGDTNSTLAGALAAAQLGIPVAHVEAGLRSASAMPEEINRIVTDRLAAFRYCPTPGAVANLRREGLPGQGHACCVGDVMYDAFLRHRPDAAARARIRAEFNVAETDYALCTIHRPANTDAVEVLRDIFNGLARIAATGMAVIVPLHPRTRQVVSAEGIDAGAARIVGPLSFTQMLALEAEARAIVTDSGGVQKEAYWAGVPCVTLRAETEWPETIEHGRNQLAGTAPDRILAAFGEAVQRGPAVTDPGAFGDGRASVRIAQDLRSLLGSA